MKIKRQVNEHSCEFGYLLSPFLPYQSGMNMCFSSIRQTNVVWNFLLLLLLLPHLGKTHPPFASQPSCEIAVKVPLNHHNRRRPPPRTAASAKCLSPSPPPSDLPTLASTTTATTATASPTTSSTTTAASVGLLSRLVLGLGRVVDQQGVKGQGVGEDEVSDR